MKGKKVVEFLILKPAFTSRNLSSLGLVALFFLVYWLAGGKVAVPSVKQGSNFGSVNHSDKLNQTSGSSAPTGIAALHHTPTLPASNSSADLVAPSTASKPDESTKALDEKLNKLNELEERLKSLKRAKTGGD